jgi:hypothetical protein
MEERLARRKQESAEADSDNTRGGSPMENMYEIGVDVYSKTISYCVKDASGCVIGNCRSTSTVFAL